MSPLLPFAFLIGVIFGSFGNVLIFRVPKGKVITGRSQCPRCHRMLRAHQLVPILSFLLLRGRCAGCKKPISIQYPLVEAASGLLFVLVFLKSVSLPATLLLAAFFWLLLLISVVDSRSQMIPDAFSFPLIAIGIAYGFIFEDLIVVCISAGILITFFGLQWIISRGAWVGSADILLGAAIGAAVADWRLACLTLVVAYIVGAVFATALLISGGISRKAHIAFGPFLAIGGIVSLLGGQYILMAVL